MRPTDDFYFLVWWTVAHCCQICRHCSGYNSHRNWLNVSNNHNINGIIHRYCLTNQRWNLLPTGPFDATMLYVDKSSVATASTLQLWKNITWACDTCGRAFPSWRSQRNCLLPLPHIPGCCCMDAGSEHKTSSQNSCKFGVFADLQASSRRLSCSRHQNTEDNEEETDLASEASQIEATKLYETYRKKTATERVELKPSLKLQHGAMHLLSEHCGEPRTREYVTASQWHSTNGTNISIWNSKDDTVHLYSTGFTIAYVPWCRQQGFARRSPINWCNYTS